jgi:hypothetical protein
MTGSDIMLIGGAGVVLPTVGAGTFSPTRRRRTSFTV